VRRLLGEPIRFLAVGLTSTAVHVLVGLCVAEFAGWAPWAANIVAFLVAMVVSYVGNSLVTFKVSARRADAFARFAMLSACAFVLNQGIVTIATEMLGWSYIAALGLVVLTVPAATFLLAKYWALAEKRS
jgi:putative flippase GtrA